MASFLSTRLRKTEKHCKCSAFFVFRGAIRTSMRLDINAKRHFRSKGTEVNLCLAFQRQGLKNTENCAIMNPRKLVSIYEIQHYNIQIKQEREA